MPYIEIRLKSECRIEDYATNFKAASRVFPRKGVVLARDEERTNRRNDSSRIHITRVTQILSLDLDCPIFNDPREQALILIGRYGYKHKF